MGASVPINPYAEFLPLAGVNIVDPNAAAEQVSAIGEVFSEPTLSGAKVAKLADNVDGLRGQFVPDTAPAAGVVFHVIGVVRHFPRAAAALAKLGPKKTVEVGAALFPFVAAVSELVTDIPGLEQGKPVAESLSFVAKVGEKFLLIPASDAQAASESSTHKERI